MRKLGYFIFFILISEIAGIIGSFFTFASIPIWYRSLQKPFFSPPNFIFAPVWTILYILMGIAAFLVWEKKKKKVGSVALKFFFFQLVLNSLWSIIFFGLKNPSLAFIEILALWITIFITAKRFYKISKLAGYLFIPYIIWVTFASILNLSIMLLN